MPYKIGPSELLLIVLCLAPVVILVIAAVAVVLVRRQKAPAAAPTMGQPAALEIAKTRYARGEITREQYEVLRRDLEQ